MWLILALTVASCAVSVPSTNHSAWPSNVTQHYYLSKAVRHFNVLPLHAESESGNILRVISASSWGHTMFTIAMSVGAGGISRSGKVSRMDLDPGTSPRRDVLTRPLTENEMHALCKCIDALDVAKLSNKMPSNEPESATIDGEDILIERIKHGSYQTVVRTGLRPAEYEHEIRALLSVLFALQLR